MADLRVGFFLLLISGLALGTKLAPSLLEKKPDGGSSAGGSTLLVESSTKDASTSSALTDVVPDGYSAAKETASTPIIEPKIDDAPVLATPMPSLDDAKPADATASTSSHSESLGGMVLPSDSSSEKSETITEVHKEEPGAPKPLASPSKESTAGKGAEPTAKKEKSSAGDSKKDEVVTEFVPFVEPVDEELKDASSKKDKSARSVASKDGKKDAKGSAADDKPHEHSDKESDAPAASASDDAPARTVSDRKKSVDGGAAEPAHPFFRRYLESKKYFVRSGDSLETIAERLYRDPAKADEILDLNRSLLSSSSDLRPGMTLKLP
jgi:hypothetical protein